eukprot:m.312838 g.312838  ORF g.312838 m.312838 type:complete len:196 (+) comp314432_c0_seq1:280-867(+)
MSRLNGDAVEIINPADEFPTIRLLFYLMRDRQKVLTHRLKNLLTAGGSDIVHSAIEESDDWQNRLTLPNTEYTTGQALQTIGLAIGRHFERDFDYLSGDLKELFQRNFRSAVGPNERPPLPNSEIITPIPTFSKINNQPLLDASSWALKDAFVSCALTVRDCIRENRQLDSSSYELENIAQFVLFLLSSEEREML